MITDELIADIFHKHGCYIDANMSAMRAVRELIALAQQVKPLEWRSRHAYTVFGTYYVSFRVTTETYSAWRNGESIVDESFETEAEAIEAAQQDYQRRVLSCLVWGGV